MPRHPLSGIRPDKPRVLQPQSCNTINPQTNDHHRKHHTIHSFWWCNPHCPRSHVPEENQMKTQKELLQILNRTTTYFYSSKISLSFHLDPNFDMVIGETSDATTMVTFKMNPDTHIIFGFKTNNAGITTSIFTPTFKLGDRRIAPDMILAVHTLLIENPASDAYFHVAGNRVTRQTLARNNSASDATAAPHYLHFLTGVHQVSSTTMPNSVSTQPYVLRFPDSVSQVSTQPKSLLSQLFARLFRNL